MAHFSALRFQKHISLTCLSTAHQLPCVNIHRTRNPMSELQTAPAAGHNSFSKDQLRSVIERIENLEGEIKELQSDKSDIYREAKGNGYDCKALREIVRIRRQDPDARQEAETILETYMHALGMAV